MCRLLLPGGVREPFAALFIVLCCINITPVAPDIPPVRFFLTRHGAPASLPLPPCPQRHMGCEHLGAQKQRAQLGLPFVLGWDMFS